MFGFHQHGGSLGGCVWMVVANLFTAAGSAQEVLIPPAVFQGLAAENFGERESAQLQLLQLARKEPEKAISLLYRQSLEDPDPEVRSRCLAALKDLVVERGYRGDGFLGISMEEIAVELPAKGGGARGIRVIAVTEGSAAHHAGIPAGAVIVGLGDRIWRQPGMNKEFSEKIRAGRPGSEVSLQLLENGVISRKPVILGERASRSLESIEGDIQKANQMAKDRFFQQWLDKRGKDPR